MKFGVIYQSFDPPPVFLEYVRAIEDLGFADLWVCDSSLHARDVFAYLTLAATHTRRVRLGVSVFQPYTRHPAIDVNGMATINEISGGRVSMAVGAGDRPQLELGFRPAPVRLVREMIQVCRRRMADGVIMMSGGTRDTLDFGLCHLRRGLSRRDRAVDVAWGAATVIADDRPAA